VFSPSKSERRSANRKVRSGWSADIPVRCENRILDRRIASKSTRRLASLTLLPSHPRQGSSAYGYVLARCSRSRSRPACTPRYWRGSNRYAARCDLYLQTRTVRTQPIPVCWGRPAGNCKLSDLLRERKLVTRVEYGGRNPNIVISPCASRALVTNVEYGRRNSNILISPCASRRARATGRAYASLHRPRTACTVCPHAAARGHAASRAHRRSARC
jgi:hypothetical protein